MVMMKGITRSKKFIEVKRRAKNTKDLKVMTQVMTVKKKREKAKRDPNTKREGTILDQIVTQMTMIERELTKVKNRPLTHTIIKNITKKNSLKY